jgi:catechol 2,3-dioxygenase-like lactoylglutathione lyase family enzyme
MDRGLTHVALVVSDPVASADFYGRFAGMQVVHERHDDVTGSVVLWLSDLTRPFVVVLLSGTVTHPLGGMNHLGVGVGTRAEVDRYAALAADEGRLLLGPVDSGYPVGYWIFVADPDGHCLELSYGQEVGLTVAEAAGADDTAPADGAPGDASG